MSNFECPRTLSFDLHKVASDQANSRVPSFGKSTNSCTLMASSREAERARNPSAGNLAVQSSLLAHSTKTAYRTIKAELVRIVGDATRGAEYYPALTMVEYQRR